MVTCVDNVHLSMADKQTIGDVYVETYIIEKKKKKTKGWRKMTLLTILIDTSTSYVTWTLNFCEISLYKSHDIEMNVGIRTLKFGVNFERVHVT